MITVANVNEYKEKYEKELREYEQRTGKTVTDELITKKVYDALSKKKKLDIDFYSFYSSFNPQGKYSNIENYRNIIDDNDSNDTDIINKAYGELQLNGKVRFKDFVNVFAPKDIDIEKVKEDFNIFGLSTADFEYSTKEIAEMRGVDPDTDVKLSELGFAQTLAQDEANQLLVTKKVLSDYFGEEIPLRYGPDTEQLEFFNPKTNSYELVNPVGVDRADIAKMGSYAVQILPELLATTAASTLGPKSAIATSALISGLTEAARLVYGHQRYGINDSEKGFMDYLRDEGKDMAALNATLTAAGFTIPKFYRMFKNFSLRGKLDPADFGGQIKNAKQANELLTKINSRLREMGQKNQLKFTLGQASGDDNFLALQHAFETNAKYGVDGILDAFNKEQAEALNTYFLTASSPYNFKALKGDDLIARDELGAKIQNTIIKRLDPRQKVLTKALEKAETNLIDAVIALPGGSQKQAGQSIRGVIQELYDDFAADYSARYTSLFESGKNRRVNTDIIKKAVASLNQRQKDTLFAKYPEIESFFKKPAGKTIKVSTLKNSLSDLRRFDRKIKSGTLPVEGEPVEGAVSKLIGSIKEQLRNDLGADDAWYKEFVSLDQSYARDKKIYKGIVADLMQSKNGVLKIADENVFEQTFKKGKAQEARIDDIYELLLRKPEHIATYKESILKQYNNFVDPTGSGKVNLVKHQRFMNDYKYALETFFGKKGAKEITKVGELAKKVEQVTAKRNKIMKQMSTSTQGKIENMDPDKIFDFLYNNKSPTTLNKVLAIIKQDDKLYKAFQTVAKEDLLFKSTNNRGEFVFEKFADYYKRNQNILTRTFADNPTYLKDLKNFRDALEITSRQSRKTTTSKLESALNDIIRARLGQFTVAGRTFTAIKKIFRSDIDRQLADIMTDPKRLKELMSLKDKKTMGPFAKQTISRLFGYYMFDEKFFEEDQYSPVLIDVIDGTRVSEAVTDVEEGDDQRELASLGALPALTSSPRDIPAPPTDTGLASIQMRQNYDTLFPQDELGSAISKRGMA
jgi:hypothetical protein